MLNLPDVTLVVVETRCHELMRLTLTDMVLKVKFGGVVIHTDKPELIGIPAVAEYIQVPDWPDKWKQGAFYYMEAACPAKTSHALLIEWDGGIRDVNSWTDEFLQYDYVGAPWVLGRTMGQRNHTVGNGGFMLLSKRMADYVYPRRNQFKIMTDMHYSRDSRPRLEKEIGAKWAPEALALQFSYEHYYEPHRSQSKPSFGYHDIFNWPLALSHDEVLRRTRLVLENEYVVRNTSKLRLLAQSWPWVRTEIGAMAYDVAIRHGMNRRQQYRPGEPTHHIGLPHHVQSLPQIRQRRPGVITQGVKA